MPGLGTDEWFLPLTSGVILQIHMEYPNDEIRRLRDLDEFTTNTDTISQR